MPDHLVEEETLSSRAIFVMKASCSHYPTHCTQCLYSALMQASPRPPLDVEQETRNF